MNKNKGFIGIGLIIAIVLGIVVVGGGAYYLGKSGSKPVVINPENILPNNENQNLPVDNKQQAKCDSNSAPWIKVVSPNGGEVYKVGDKMTIKWDSCNVEANTQLRIYLSESLSSGAHANSIPIIQSTFNDGVETFVNDGSEAFVLDSTIYDYFGKTDGYQFKIYIVDSCSGSGCIGPSDYSDNSFTINSAPKTVSTTFPTQYISSQGGRGNWPPVIQTLTVAYSCTPSSGFGDTPTIIKEKIINGKKYCITSITDHAMGQWGTEYTYITPNGSGTKTTHFQIIGTSCSSAYEPGTKERDICQTEENQFDMDAIIANLM